MTYADTYSQPDAPDPVLTDERVLELARTHVPGINRVVAVDESGGEARAYMCDQTVVVKTQRPPRLRPRTSLRKEALILEHLAAAAVLVPRLLGYGQEEDVEYLVMTRIPGIPLEQAAIPEPERIAVLEALGSTLRRIHEVDQEELENSGLIPGDAGADDLRRRVSAGFEAAILVLEADPLWPKDMDLRGVADSCLRALPSEADPVTLHSNPGPEHCFVDPAGNTFSGLIDFGDAYRSHPALDVRSWASLQDSRHMLEGYRALGPLSPGFEDVWRAGILITQLRLAARGHRTPTEVRETVSELLNPLG